MKLFLRFTWAVSLAFLSLMVAAKFLPTIRNSFHWEFFPLLAVTIWALVYSWSKSLFPVRFTFRASGKTPGMRDIPIAEVLNTNFDTRDCGEVTATKVLHPDNVISRLRSGSWLRYNLGFSEEGQDIAEYAVILAVILVVVIGTVRLIGNNANNVFSKVGASIDSPASAPPPSN